MQKCQSLNPRILDPLNPELIETLRKGIPLRVPLMFNLRRDPYERAEITSNTYYDWLLDHAFLLVPAQAYVGRFLATFKEFPPRQKAASFSLDQVMEQLKAPGGTY